jgi:hypothetical protein
VMLVALIVAGSIASLNVTVMALFVSTLWRHCSALWRGLSAVSCQPC